MTGPVVPPGDSNRYGWLGLTDLSVTDKETATQLAFESVADPDWGACLIAKALRAALAPENARPE